MSATRLVVEAIGWTTFVVVAGFTAAAYLVVAIEWVAQRVHDRRRRRP